MAEITPIAGYGSYPITGVPENGMDNDADELTAIYQDIYNRLVYIKNIADLNTTKIANASTKIGVTFDDATLPVFTSDFLLNINKTIIQALETLDTYLSGVSQKFDNMATNIGGGVEESAPLTYSVPAYISTGDSHHVALESLATELHTANSVLAIAGALLATTVTRVDNIKDKISATADSAGTGLVYTSNNFLIDNMQVDEALSTLDVPTMANRRINERNFRETLYNWRDLNVISTDDHYFDSLYNDTKIDAVNSTATAYSFNNQSFGRDDISWTYYSVVKTVTSGTNTIKMKLDGYGTVTPYIAMHGIPGGTFTYVSAYDTWITVPAGVSLIVKIVGGIGARLYSYELLHKVV
jgi:hypothetical protein